MWCCGTDVLKNNGKYRKSVFDKRQIDALQRKFNYVSGNQKYITRYTFKKNIGYLGIRAVTSFLDRIFNSFDIDEDNKISLEDFIEYMEILKDGTDDQKAQISFNLIYMQRNQKQPNKQRRNSLSKNNSENAFQLKNETKKKKSIDMAMFEQFFEDFYKSWSSITNESIPKQTKTALKQFIRELFTKVQADGYKTIDLDYYKKLYKDREFMMAFRQINSKLGNFFIKTTNNEYQKNIALFHKTLKKIMNLSQRVFPLQNRAFIDDLEKSKLKSTLQSPSFNRRNDHETDDFFDQNVDKYFYDAKRYEYDNIFQAKQEDKSFSKNQSRGNTRIETKETKENFTKPQSIFSRVKEANQNPSKIPTELNEAHNQTIYKSKLEDHVAFLQRKLLFLQNAFKQILDQTKQIYNEMHQEFIKIFERIQKQQHEKETQMRQYSQDRANKRKESPGYSDDESPQKNTKRQNKETKRKDDKKVFFGDKNFNLVLEIMVGIQMSVRSVSGFQQIIFEEPQDFNLKHTFQMDYGHFGQNDVLYTFTDYAPNVFNHIRKIYGIGTEEYISSIGPNKMMSALIMGKMASFEQLVSEGKSGSFFYHTQDGKYLIKTISQREFYLMRKILEEYFWHIKANPQTLMPRIFGLHKITETIKKSLKKDDNLTYYLIVMNNFFNTKDKFVDRYDLKGSWVGRQNTTSHGVKKDLNFLKDKRSIDIEFDQKVQLYKLIEKDVQFFARNQIIDYSLLLGFVQSTVQKKSTRIPRTYSLLDMGNDHFQSQDAKKGTPHILQQKHSMNFKFRSQSKSSESYLFGIIDILTEYNSRKKAEYLFKGCIYDAKGISAVPPEDYKNRFLEFLKFEVFKIANHDEMPKKLPVCKKSRSRSKAQTERRISENVPLFKKSTTTKQKDKEEEALRDGSQIPKFDLIQRKQTFS